MMTSLRLVSDVVCKRGNQTADQFPQSKKSRWRNLFLEEYSLVKTLMI